MHITYFIGYVYHICLQDTIQSTLSLCLLCQAMLLPMPLRPLLLTTRSGFNITPAFSVVPIASKGGTRSTVAHSWADWRHNPCYMQGHQRLITGDKNTKGPLVRRLDTKPLPSRGSPLLQNGGQNHHRPIKGRVWLHNPCCVQAQQRFITGDKNTKGPLVGRLGT